MPLESTPPETAANPIDVAVGARIRLVRRARGMSQEKLADGLGLTFQQVQKYERGSNRVSASKLVEIARMLEVPASELLGEEIGGGSQIDWAAYGEASSVVELYNQLPTPALQHFALKLLRDVVEFAKQQE